MVAPAIPFITSKGSGSGSVTTTAASSAGVTALRVVVVSQATTPTPTITDSKTNTWVADGSSTLLNASFGATVWAFKATTNIVGASHTFTCTGTDAASIWVIGFGPAGGGTVSVSDWSATTDASSPYTSPSGTAPGADTRLITVGMDDGSGSSVTQTWDTSFSTVAGGAITDQNSFWGGSMGKRSPASGGSYSSGYTTTASGVANSVIGIYAATETGGATSIPSSLSMMGCGV